MKSKLAALGDLAKDKVSGYTGIVTSSTSFLNGCVRLGITPNKLDKEGKVQQTEVFDIEQVQVIKACSYKRVTLIETGGDRPTPISRTLR